MKTDEPLRILTALGAELERATAADEARTAGRRRHWWTGHLPVIALLLGLSATGATAAATHLFGLAAPIPAPRTADTPRDAQVIASTVALAGVGTPDPDGLPPWDVRVSRSRSGDRCTAVGQVVDGKFGIVGLDQKFRVLSPGAADVCGLPPVGTQVQVGARAALGRGSMTARTLVVGLAGPSITQVTLEHGGQRTALPIGRDHAFLGVLPGLPTESRPVVTTTDRAGRTRTFDLAAASLDEAADPDGGQPWLIRRGPMAKFVGPPRPDAPKPKTPDDAQCVSLRQTGSPQGLMPADGRFPDGAVAPTVCRLGDQDAPLVATMRRLTPSLDYRASYVYGTSPARTVAIGIARDDVVRVELHTPGGALPVRLTADHAFAVVLDGRTDPLRLELRARLRDGSISTLADDTATLIGFTGRTLKLRRDPPWADAAAVQARAVASNRPTPIAGSTHVVPGVRDPAGGPDWAIRSWLATGPAPMSNSQKPATLGCAVFGPLVDGVVRAPRGAGVGPGPAGATMPRPLDGCALDALRPRTRSRSGRPSFQTQVTYFTNPHVYIDDPASATPKIARVVLSSVYPGAVAATVVGLPKGRQVPATVGPHGAVLALLPPEAAEHTDRLRFRLKIDNGTTVTTDYMAAPFVRAPVARAVDPKGGATWGVRAVTLREPWYPGPAGQLVAPGRSGRIDDRTGEVFFSTGFSGGPFRPTRSKPVSFQVDVQFDTGEVDRPAPADVARRTLPGRTILAGAAAPGVTRVTIHTPRDVRTVRPSKVGGLFLVVYDGRFTRGQITVVADGPGIHGLLQRPADPYR